MARIGVIGVGKVGATTAYALSAKAYCEELILIDPNKKSTYAIALDIEQASYVTSNCPVRLGSYDDIADLDFLVITAGTKPQIAQGGTRLTGMKEAYGIVKEIAGHIKEKGFDGALIVASNPLDVMTYAFFRLTGLPREKVIGTGCFLDTDRYITLLAKRLSLPRKRIRGYVLGEHGDTSFPVFSATTIDGMPLKDYLVENNIPESVLDGMTEDVRTAGYEIATRLGSTYYGIASIISRIIEDLLDEEGEDLPLSLIAEGRMGHGDIAISLPYHVSRYGLFPLPVKLTSEEQNLLQESAKAIRSYIESLDIDDTEKETRA